MPLYDVWCRPTSSSPTIVKTCSSKFPRRPLPQFPPANNYTSFLNRSHIGTLCYPFHISCKGVVVRPSESTLPLSLLPSPQKGTPCFPSLQQGLRYFFLSFGTTILLPSRQPFHLFVTICMQVHWFSEHRRTPNLRYISMLASHLTLPTSWACIRRSYIYQCNDYRIIPLQAHGL